MRIGTNQAVGCQCCLQECDDRDYIKYLKTFKRDNYRYLSIEEQDTIDFEEAVQSHDIKIVNNCGMLTDKGYKKTTFWYNVIKLFKGK